MVREGTAEEAGVMPDTAEKIDAALTKWAGDTDQAFAVCVVRNGVIVIHKAYGTRDGKPITVANVAILTTSIKPIPYLRPSLAIRFAAPRAIGSAASSSPAVSPATPISRCASR